MKTISVAMATHFGEKFLRDQLNSINDQTTKPFELVVCDDCSTDKTRSILQEFASTASFPVYLYFNERKLGYIDNFFKAISLCNGDYIALSDQDDIWYKDKIEVSLKILTQENVWLHAHSVTLVDEQGSLIGKLRPLKFTGPVSYRTFNPWGVFSGFTCSFKRELIDLFPKKNRPIDLIHSDGLMAHDRWINHLGLLAGRVIYSDIPLAAYRQHSDNVFGARKQNSIDKIKKVRSEYLNYLGKRASFSREMCELAKILESLNSEEGRCNTEFWASIAKNYSERERIFIEQRSLLNRSRALFTRFPHDRDLRKIMEDLLAAVILAF